MTNPFVHIPKTGHPKPGPALSDTDIELLLEADGEHCERPDCELSRYLLQRKMKGDK